MTAHPTALRLRPPRPRGQGLLVFGFVAVLLLLLLPSLVTLGAEWPWFRALGYERVFATRLVAKALLGVGVGLVAFAFLYTSLRFAQRGVVPDAVVLRSRDGAAALDVTRLLRRMALPIALGLALLFALAATGGWLDVLRRDVVLLGRRVTVEPSARWHLAGLIALLFLLAAVRVYFVRVPGLLYSTTGPLVGASFADLHATLTGLRLAGLAAVAGGALVLWGTRTQRLAWATLLALGVYFGVSLLGVVLYPAIVQQLVVAPNELVKETPQLASHIAATRRAWGLDRVVTRDLTGEIALAERDIEANRPTIQNVRLWDREPLLQTFGQLQEIRTYYDFVSVDDDRYWIDGQYRQVLLSPRELNSASLPTRTFINERLTFTHGMGLTLGPVNQVTPEGLPVLFIKD